MVMNFKPLEGTVHYEITEDEVNIAKSLEGKKRILNALVAEGHSDYLDDYLNTTSEMIKMFDVLRAKYSIPLNRLTTTEKS
jgi:hypothetical protein